MEIPVEGKTVYPRRNIRTIGLHSKNRHVITEVKKLQPYDENKDGFMPKDEMEQEGGYWIKTDRLGDEWYAWSYFHYR